MITRHYKFELYGTHLVHQFKELTQPYKLVPDYKQNITGIWEPFPTNSSNISKDFDDTLETYLRLGWQITTIFGPPLVQASSQASISLSPSIPLGTIRRWENYAGITTRWWEYKETSSGIFICTTNTILPTTNWVSSGFNSWITIEQDMVAAGYNEVNIQSLPSGQGGWITGFGTLPVGQNDTNDPLIKYDDRVFPGDTSLPSLTKTKHKCTCKWDDVYAYGCKCGGI